MSFKTEKINGREVKLVPILDGKYELLGIKPGPVILPDGTRINFQTCKAKDADRAIKVGCKLIRKASKEPTKQPPPSENKTNK